MLNREYLPHAVDPKFFYKSLKSKEDLKKQKTLEILNYRCI